MFWVKARRAVATERCRCKVFAIVVVLSAEEEAFDVIEVLITIGRHQRKRARQLGVHLISKDVVLSSRERCTAVARVLVT